MSGVDSLVIVVGFSQPCKQMTDLTFSNSLANLTARLATLAIACCGTASVDAQSRAEKRQPVPRVERPQFTQSDWDGIYFENLFEEGLVGERPQANALQAAHSPTESPSGSNSETSSTTNSVWNQLISSTTIEDEVKSIQKQLVTDITTPVRFKSDYPKAHQSFSVLSMLFAIVSQYEGDVRWKEDSARAQVAFWRAASNSRVGTTQAYESCKSRLELLNEMVRGGKFVSDEKAPEDFDWSNIVDRNPLMHRLDQSLNRLKAAASNKSEFTKMSAELVHDSELIAAIAHVLTQENMTDADDEGYNNYAQTMQRFAREATQSAKSNDFEATSRAINSISQSCDACHADWR